MQFERSHLFVAGSNQSTVIDALDSVADVIVVDLEDTVAPAAKETARAETLETLAEYDVNQKRTAIRVNGLDTDRGIEDIQTIATAEVQPDLLLIPDIRDAGEIRIVDDVLDDYGTTIQIHPLIENPSAMFDVHRIARMSDRTYALTFAAIDFQLNMGMSILDENNLSVPRYLLSMAANSADVLAIDKPNLKAVHDREQTRAEAEAAKMVGFDGKIAMNESQAEVINDVFSPSEEDVERAKRFINAFEATDEGLVEIEGAAVDKPVIDQLRDTLERARQAETDK